MKPFFFFLFFCPSLFAQQVIHFDLKSADTWEKITAAFSDNSVSKDTLLYFLYSEKSTRVRQVLEQAATLSYREKTTGEDLQRRYLSNVHVFYLDQKPFIVYFSSVDRSRMGSCGEVLIEHYYLLGDNKVEQFLNIQRPCIGIPQALTYEQIKVYFRK